MKYSSSDYETLGRQVAAGHYVTRSFFLLSVIFALVIGALGMYIIMPSPQSPSGQRGDGSFKVPMDSAQNQQSTSQLNAILELQNRLTITPNDESGWIQLGNLYYDTNNPAKSIEAYEKALALNPKNPDVLVDSGVMYRALKQYDKALENFNKALAINEKHEFALFNSGVVLHNDLRDDKAAFTVWEKLVALNPKFTTPSGQLLSDILKEHYKTGQ